jgi:hypothetical protein
MDFVELLVLVGAFFSVYVIIWLFVLIYRTLYEIPMLGWSETSIMGMKWNVHYGMMWNAHDGDDWSFFCRYTNMR